MTSNNRIELAALRAAAHTARSASQLDSLTMPGAQDEPTGAVADKRQCARSL